MSETVIVAIITLLSGVFGASVGGFITYKVAKLSSLSDRTRLLHEEKLMQYSKFLSAYFDYTACLRSGAINGASAGEDEFRALAALSDAYSGACILSSESTAAILKKLLDLSTAWGAARQMPDGIAGVYTQVICAFRTEVKNFDAPPTQ